MDDLWRTTLQRIQEQFQNVHNTRLSFSPPGLRAMLVESALGARPNEEKLDLGSIPGIDSPTNGQPSCNGWPIALFNTGSHRDIKLIYDAKGHAVFTDKPFYDVNGNPICNSAGDAFAFRPGAARMQLGFGAVQLAQEYQRLATGAAQCLPSIAQLNPELVLRENIEGVRPGPSWFNTVFELAWRKYDGSPLVADRMAWSDNMQFRVDELPLMKEAGWPEGLSQIASSIGDPPFHWFSELPDLLASSIYAIDILLSKTQPEAPAIQLNTADKKLAAPNPPESKPQLDPSIRAVLKRLASSETMLVIDDIAGSSGCPRDAKTVGKIVKKLIEDGYAVRPSRYGVKITDKGRQAL